jgi:predicted nucleic acid-binding protein
MALVIDASVAIGWIVRTQATPLTSAALSFVARESGRVPSHFGVEVARALRNQERRSLLPSDIVDSGLAALRALPLKQDDSNMLERMIHVVALARRHALRVADAVYLELAIRMALPLATRDRSLASAAMPAGVTLFET